MSLRESITWSIPSDPPGVEILSAKHNQRPWCTYHNTYTICNIDDFFNEKGVRCPRTAEWAYRRRIYHSSARTLMLLEPGEVHRNTIPPPPCNFSVVLVDPNLVNDIAYEEGMRPYPHFMRPTADNQQLYRTFVRLHAALAKQTTQLHRQSLLIECVGALLIGYCEKTPHPTPHPGRRGLARARDFLEEHFAEKISVSQLAEISGLSRYHFQRAFAGEFGLPPHAYQIILRIEKVRQLLRIGVPIQSIEAGFADQSHLIRRFKDVMGVTPGTYANMIRSRDLIPHGTLSAQTARMFYPSPMKPFQNTHDENRMQTLLALPRRTWRK